ncbi:MAG: sugar transferase [Paludibacteraceae bacterium]|nr:sugar transferase [Paludibacteraceae bacterium]
MKKLFFNKKLFFLDFFYWIVSVFIVWFWRFFSEKVFVLDYILVLAVAMVAWLGIAFFCGRYNKYLSFTGFFPRLLRLILVTVVFAILTVLLSSYFVRWVSSDVLIAAFSVVGVLAIIGDVLYFAYRYALNVDDRVPSYKNTRPPQSLNVPVERLLPADLKNLENTLYSLIGQKGINVLRQYVDLGASTTKCLITGTLFNVSSLRAFHYDTIVNLMPLNTIRGINKIFCTVNTKLPDNGKFVCCFTSQEIIKKEIYRRHSKFVARLIYFFYFIFRRVIPRMFFTHRLYFDLTNGKRRMITETEVLGRLYFCGFAVDRIVREGRLLYVFAHRQKQPEPQVPRRWYGLFIQLPRIGKNYDIVQVYKTRTMHPYSEFLQQYIYEQQGLQEGGKFKHDPRVTRIGHMMRKCWLDELPMILNLLKGDMKLVGVRPLSRQYFGLYPPELQELRTRFKPGLIPPFYVDLPKTQDEIFASERKYLEAYARHPFATDFRYFFLVIYTIVFKRARSN